MRAVLAEGADEPGVGGEEEEAEEGHELAFGPLGFVGPLAEGQVRDLERVAFRPIFGTLFLP
jgi:hypothetical protein